MSKKLFRRTKRLIVRPVERADYTAWKKAQTSHLPPKNLWDLGPLEASRVTRKAFGEKLKHEADLRRRDLFYSLGVFDKAGNYIGAVSIMEVARGISHTAYLGYRLFNRYWGKGFAKEAVRACIDIAFRDVKLHRFEAGIEPENRASIALAKSLGMRREGVKKRALYLRGQWVDLLMFTLTTEDVGVKFDTRVLKNLTPRS